MQYNLDRHYKVVLKSRSKRASLESQKIEIGIRVGGPNYYLKVHMALQTNISGADFALKNLDQGHGAFTNRQIALKAVAIRGQEPGYSSMGPKALRD